MTSPITKRRSDATGRGQRRAFTLVELLLVMTLLIAVISLAAPSLGRFIHGRTIDSEAHRLLALTHAGQSRAVSEGVPVVLWLDARNGEYGLEAESGFSTTATATTGDERSLEFTLDPNLQMEVVENLVGQLRPKTTSRVNAGLPVNKNKQRNLPEIRFQPDGSFDETSPTAVRLVGRDEESIWIAQSLNRLNYEIRHQPNEPDSLAP
jgi:type II secretion system protein H